jgi:nucleoid-associated protein YgaU
MKRQHLIWALAGGALLLVLALAAWQGSGSREPVTASAPALEPAAVKVAAGSAAPAPDVPAAAPVAVAPPASSDEVTAPTANPDVNASDPMTDRERVAQQRARVR